MAWGVMMFLAYTLRHFLGVRALRRGARQACANMP